jgi:hypothetical protein
MILWKIFQIGIFFSVLMLFSYNGAFNGNGYAQAVMAFLAAGFATAFVVEIEFRVKRLISRLALRKLLRETTRDTRKSSSELPRLRIDL